MTTARRELGPHVTRWEGENAGRVPFGNPLTVSGTEMTILLDSAIGIDVPHADLLLLSHYHEDHSVDAVERATEVAIHREDAAAIRSWEDFVAAGNVPRGDWEEQFRREFRWQPIPDVYTFDDDAVYDLGGGVQVAVVPLPGHTAGHCGFLIEPDGVFYIADVDLSAFGPMYGDRNSSLADTRATLRAVAEVDARVVATYHHKGPYFSQPEFLADLASHAAALDAREGRLLDLLAARPRTIDDLVGCGVVFRTDTAPWYGRALEHAMIGMHLDDLRARGEVAGPDDGLYLLS